MKAHNDRMMLAAVSVIHCLQGIMAVRTSHQICCCPMLDVVNERTTSLGSIVWLHEHIRPSLGLLFKS